MKIQVYGKSVVGNGRQRNEDQIFCQGHYRNNLDEQQDVCKGKGDISDLLVFAIFDGMGGLANGEKASEICAEMMAEDLQNSLSGKGDFRTADSIMRMNRRIVQDGQNAKMGSTAVVAECRKDTLQVINIGDSRAYWFHDHSVTQLSVDHTLEERLRRLRAEYEISIVESEYQKHALTQYVGVPEDEFLIEPYMSECITAVSGDQCLLCSDGLSNLVSEEQMADVLQQDIDNEEKVNHLLDVALRNERTDNISIILICCVE